MMATYYPEYPQQEPLIKECLPEQTLQLAAKTSLFGNLDNLAQVETSLYPEKDGRVGANHGLSPI